jgi:SulP family sulfate permease
VWLLLAVLFIPGALNAIPLAALAAVLLHVGYKLAPISLLRTMYRQGLPQFLPFVATVAGILLTDLLVGVGIGLVVGVFFVLRANLATPYFLHDRTEKHEPGKRDSIRLELSENVSFLNKAAVNRALHGLAPGSRVEIDGSTARHIDHDVVELIHEFAEAHAPSRNIEVTLTKIPEAGRLAAH